MTNEYEELKEKYESNVQTNLEHLEACFEYYLLHAELTDERRQYIKDMLKFINVSLNKFHTYEGSSI
jgi:endonuclease III-like uncharacterized protein